MHVKQVRIEPHIYEFFKKKADQEKRSIQTQINYELEQFMKKEQGE